MTGSDPLGHHARGGAHRGVVPCVGEELAMAVADPALRRLEILEVDADLDHMFVGVG